MVRSVMTTLMWIQGSFLVVIGFINDDAEVAILGGDGSM